MSADLSALGAVPVAAARVACIALLFYCLPLAAYAVLKRSQSGGSKALAAGLYGALALPIALSSGGMIVLAVLLVPWLYLALAAFGVFQLRRALQAGRISTPALLVVLVFVYLVLPGLLVQIPSQLLLLAVGFEHVFSGFSYCKEAGARNQPVSLRDCLRFMLVNPTLVYTQQGTPILGPIPRAAAARRMLLGAAALLVHGGLMQTLPALGLGYDAEAIRMTDARSYLLFFATIYGHLAVAYATHSGMSSVQIGAMALLGHRLPERYHYPFLATSPLDLWRRWNLYLGQWLQRYAFVPLALRWQSRLPFGRRRLSKGIAVLATFALCGAIHEAVGYARGQLLPLGVLLGFVLCGVSVIVWAIVVPVLRRLAGRVAPRRRGMLNRAGTAVSGLAFSHVSLLFGWCALPALAGYGLPGPLWRALLPG